MNNLGYALFQTGQPQEAYELYQRALALQPDFPEALNNVGIFFGQQRDLERAEPYFRRRSSGVRPTAKRPTTSRSCSTRAAMRPRRSRCSNGC